MATTVNNNDSYTIKEVGSGWDVRNLSYDQPIVKVVDTTGEGDDAILDSGWTKITQNDEDWLIHDDPCIHILLESNQPVSVDSCYTYAGGGELT